MCQVHYKKINERLLSDISVDEISIFMNIINRMKSNVKEDNNV